MLHARGECDYTPLRTTPLAYGVIFSACSIITKVSLEAVCSVPLTPIESDST